MPEGARPPAAHPSREELKRFLLGTLERDAARAVVAHLLHGCAECSAPLAQALFPPPSRPGGGEYDFPIQSALTLVRREHARQHPPRAAAPPPARELLAAMLPPLPPMGERAWAQCEALLEASWSVRHDDPEQMVWLASAAVSVAEKIEPATRGPRLLADLQARALAALGNARRVGDDAREAEADLMTALDRFDNGTGEAVVLAEILERLGIVYRYQRRFTEARRAFGWALRLYEQEGKTHEGGVVLMHSGLAAMYAPAPQEAAEQFLAALPRLDPDRELRVVAFCLHNLAACWTDLGLFEEARDLVWQSRELFAACPDPLIRVKFLWLDARIAAGLGYFGRAERHFQRAREVFLARKLPYTAAVVALDLAALWLERGHTAQARALVLETVNTFGLLRIPREAAAAVMLLGEAAQQDGLTAAILHSAAAELQKIER